MDGIGGTGGADPMIDAGPDEGMGTGGNGGGTGGSGGEVDSGEPIDLAEGDQGPDTPEDVGGTDVTTDVTVEAGSDLAPDHGGYDGPPGKTPNVAGEILISEILPDSQALVDDLGEWFEVYNPSTDTIYDLNGCTMSDDGGNMYRINQQLIMMPGTYHSLALSAMAFPPDFIYTTAVKFNSQGPDGIAIICNGVTIDHFSYVLANIQSGHTLSVDPSHLKYGENNLPGNFCASNVMYFSSTRGINYGTPNARNPPCPAGMF